MPEIQHFKMQPIHGQPTGLNLHKKHSPKKPKISKNPLILSVVLAIVLGAIIGAIFWYKVQLSPAGDDSSQLTLVDIKSGTSSTEVGKILEDNGLIRSSLAFDIYIFLSGKGSILKAGTYRLTSADSVQRIVGHIANGAVDTFNITFYPGATLVDNTNNTNKYDVTTVLEKAGYTKEEIQTGLEANYDSSLFDGSPSGADLEGYIYGDTYTFNTGATVEQILQATFDEFYQKISDDDLINLLKQKDMTLYEGITLASIIQKEVGSQSGVSSPSDYQREVAQVFLSRLDIGMSLGSDVTYQYICDKLGVERDPDYDSPYNTRKYTGLPPGPIAVPDITSLEAVVNPTDTEYLYFLSGDDKKMYFAKTYEEHQANISKYCIESCSLL